MKLKLITTTKKARVEIIPMIDIMFFLLVTIMIASVHVKHNNFLQFNQKVNLPKGTIDESVIKDQQNIIIQSNNSIIYQEKTVEINELKFMLSNINRAQGLIISADTNASHGRVIEVIDLAKSLRITNFSIVTKK